MLIENKLVKSAIRLAFALLALFIISSCGSDRSENNNNPLPPIISNPQSNHSGDAIPYEQGKYISSLSNRFYVKIEMLSPLASKSNDLKVALYFLDFNSLPANAVGMISFELYFPTKNHKSDESRQFFYRDPKYPDLVEVDGLDFNFAGKVGEWNALIIARVNGERDSALIALPEVL